MTRLTEKTLPALSRIPGRHPVPNVSGLKLKVTGDGRAYWTYRFRLKGKGVEISLGAYPGDAPTVKAAKALHAKEYDKVTDGIDPRADKRARKAAAAAASAMPTFGEVAEMYIASKSGEWTSPRHRQQWEITLLGPEGTAPRTNAAQPDHCRSLRPAPIDKVDTDLVLKTLEPIWKKVPQTASRLRGRIEAVIDYARVRYGFDQDRRNPAAWRGHLNKVLAKPKKRVNGHHAALSYKDIPAFIAALRRPTTAARALEFLILNVSREGEVLNMTWDELGSLDERLWIVPPERMKTREQHRVPLSDRAVKILEAQRDAPSRRSNNPFVFPGLLPGRPLSRQPLTELTKKLSPSPITVHGFRSSFRDWALVVAKASEAVAEQCLAHAIGSDVRKAYARDDLLELRAPLMQQWADYCAGEPKDAKKAAPFMGKRRLGSASQKGST
jgi:integrase